MKKISELQYMSLSNSVKTVLLDPTVQNNSRCEFRIPDGTYSSAIKLIDLGSYNAAVTDATGVYYPHILGVLASIKKISLFADSLKLDEIQELAAWGSIQNLRSTNQASEDLARFEGLNSTNYSISPNGQLTMDATKKDYRQVDDAGVNRWHNATQVAASSEDQQSGTLVLSNYLEFLRSVQILPNIPNLRLMIEWQNSPENFYDETQTGGAYYPIRPTLLLEEIVGAPPVNNGPVKMPYMQNIVERFVVDAKGTGTTQQVSFRSGAFKNRFVKDLTFYNKRSTADGWWLGNERSVAQAAEKLQVVINGSKYLPDQGINTPAMKQAYFNDTMGPLNVCAANYNDGLIDSANNYAAAAAKFDGNFSVTAVQVNAMVERLDVEYERLAQSVQGNAVHQADGIGQFDLLMFGRTARVLEMNGSQLKLTY